ncbi:MAG: fimbrillin family protein [Muribaculaceae bacterium]|nr:fimbrillin family protein [Muribaculaceae bacterium]
MKILRVTYYALVALVSVASCSKEATEPDIYDRTEENIYFKTSITDIASSRAEDMTLERLESFQVTCFNTRDIQKDAAGFVTPYFENATFIRQANAMGVTYVSSPEEGTYSWPLKSGKISFFAFSPSLEVMSTDNSAVTDANRSECFNLVNATVQTESSVNVDYRLSNVRINPDISRQFDFISAKASGERWKEFASGVELAFSHELCEVELKAWGQNESYDFEIAGVRLGNPVVEGTFVFADDTAPANVGRWATDYYAVKDKVEYLYRSTETSGSEGNQGAGDKIIRINDTEHNTPESAVSLMGQGGCAMMIPTFNTKWEGLDDPYIGDTPYHTDRMYFSILTRVTDRKTGKIIYPYPGNQNKMTVISYAVDKDGNIARRLYAGKTVGTYFIDSELTSPYEAPEEGKEEIMDFGWAAVPVDVDWRAGKKYVYTLNYSEGIGIHDPADPEPGKLIVGPKPIEWSVSVSDWVYAESDENYDPDLDVPN